MISEQPTAGTEETTSLTYKTLPENAGTRLDAFLAEKIEGWSRSRLQRLIEGEDVLVNEKTVKPSYRLREGDEIEVELTEMPVTRFEPEDIPLEIVFEDEYLAVINKPAGMVVHPGAGVQNGTLANAIAYRFGSEETEQGVSNRVGIVHRLDKDTSGLIVVAKSNEIHEALSEQFRERQVFKSYVALVHGSPERNSGKVEASIGRNKHNRLRMKVSPQGRSALSLWTVRSRYTKFTLLDVEIKTGRTHQIRVHLAYVNHPVVGDEIYNEGRDNTVADINIRNAIKSMGRFFLHAERLSFTHPVTSERQEFTVSLPPELSGFLQRLEESS
jgi:23S rRNA pseudouridine1911/1915/1917 synthase